MADPKNMLTILHLITSLERGGAETMLAKLARAMKPMNARSIIVSMTGPGVYGPELEREGFRVFSLGAKRGLPDPRALVRLIKIIRQEKPDLIQTWLYHADLLGLIAAKLTGAKPLCWNIRCSDMDMRQYSLISQLMPHLLGKLSKVPDAVFVNAQAGQSLHERFGYKPRAWHVIPNGFDTELFKPDAALRQQARAELGLPDEAPVVGMVARFDPMKNHAGFLDAAENLAAQNAMVRFVMAGPQVETANPGLKKALSGILKDRVWLLGPQSDMPRLMNTLDVLCLPSFSEGFPNVLGEAMACGVPCVSTDVGDAATIISDTGLTVPPRDSKALIGALHKMLELSPKARRNLGSAARRRIEGNYALPVIAKRYLDVYEGLIR